jgi:hypothetical protein
MMLIAAGAALAALVLFVSGILWRHRKASTCPVTLSDRKVVTITANHILLDSEWRLDDKTRLALSLLTKRACVFLFVFVRDSDEASARESIIARQFRGLVPSHQILFCQTAAGRAAMAAQLDAVVHLDFDPAVLNLITTDRKTVLIAPNAIAKHADWMAPTLKEFVTSGNTDFFRLLR